MARPHEEQKRTFSEDTAPQPEQVTMRTDCTAQRGGPVKPTPGIRLPSIYVRFAFSPTVAKSPLHSSTWLGRHQGAGLAFLPDRLTSRGRPILVAFFAERGRRKPQKRRSPEQSLHRTSAPPLPTRAVILNGRSPRRISRAQPQPSLRQPNVERTLRSAAFALRSCRAIANVGASVHARAGPNQDSTRNREAQPHQTPAPAGATNISPGRSPG
jgi:hypothetical protein